jgi:hypothetical protein
MTTTHADDSRDRISFGHGADKRLARAVLDAGRAATRSVQGSARAKMLEGLRTAAAGVAAALAATRGKGPAAKPSPAARKKTTTALLVACGGLEQAIRAVVPAERRAAQRVGGKTGRADESAA